MLVSELENALFNILPRAWSEPWDKVGLLVGNPNAEVSGIALALDASAHTVARAQELGANVLITHHPVCLSMPAVITSDSSLGGFASNCLWEAVKRDVAVMSFHTNLDRYPQATVALPRLLGYEAIPGIEISRDAKLGRLGSYALLGRGTTMAEFSARCKTAFGGAQVYGRTTQLVSKAAFFTGSIGDLGLEAVNQGCDVVVCGECSYHKALELVHRGCSVVILGHDVSEMPLVEVLAEILDEVGISRNKFRRIDEEPNWQYF